MEERAYLKSVRAWAMYDWANSSFATTIMAAILPVYYSTYACKGLAPAEATSNWAFTATIALILVAIIGPVLGAMADFSGAKKRFFTAFVLMGVAGTALLYFVGTGDWLLASGLYIIGNIGFSGSIVFYDSFLPHIAKPEDIDQVSSRGFATGYLGGGLLLAINVASIMLVPETMTQLMMRLAFFSVAVWWLVFTIPFWRTIKEPLRRIHPDEAAKNPFSASFGRLGKTFKELRTYRQLLKLIVAFWLYNNGIGTIITMATIYGTELGFGMITTVGTLLMVQFVAMPFAILFGKLAKRIGTKPAILLSLGVYTLIAIGGYFLQVPWHFWVLGFFVATVQGGSQALSRSLFGRMMPKSKSAEFFGFFSVSEKIAGAVGPFVFGVVSKIMGGSRLSIVSLIIFFIAGGLLLTTVDEKEGIRVAEAEEAVLIKAAGEGQP